LLTIIKTPNYIESAFNKVTFQLQKSDYQIGDLFYLEIYSNSGELITRLVQNGNGQNSAEFDIASVLQTQFPKPKVLNPSLLVQKDETALVTYSVKAGFVKFVEGSQVYEQLYCSGKFHALRAALPKDGSETINSFVTTNSQTAKFLTSINSEQPQGNDLFMPVLVATGRTLKFVIESGSEFYETSFIASSEGVYVFNARPSLYGLTTTNLTVWVESDDNVYQTTYTNKTDCPEGSTGYGIATVTAFSTISQEDANTKAIQDSAALSEASRVCVMRPSWSSTKTFTAVCPEGSSGEYTATVTATSYESQEDADAKAQTQAQDEAYANLTCNVAEPAYTGTTYTSTKSYTAYCGSGETGEYTSTQTRTSTISQADADSKANQAAQDDANNNLVCVINENPSYGTFSHYECQNQERVETYHDGNGGFYYVNTGNPCDGSEIAYAN
jgi:hypothetical protein